VLIDSPPVSILADSVVLASMADAMAMVIRHNQNDRDLIRRSLKRLRDSNVEIVGAVLNGVDLERTYYGDYYYSGYHERTDAEGRPVKKGTRRRRDEGATPAKKVAL
jgi:succinoglycan biosynthesis transport protein ExoP